MSHVQSGSWVGGLGVGPCVFQAPFLSYFVSLFLFIFFFSVASVGGLGFVNLVENEWLVVCVGLGETLRINFV